MNSNLHYLNSSNYKFKTETIWIDWSKKQNDKYEKKQIAFLCLHNKTDHKDIVHPLTEFVFTYWKFSSYNTQRKHALNLSTFLNYLIDNRHQLKITSIKDLKISHGKRFENFSRRKLP
ncbi:hypothetical protein BN1058_00704 [Paraliobacillus sp. PM-2]|nr:hypothetical protein BN1058_00704 [Paraliobacillus sp. PM-2]